MKSQSSASLAIRFAALLAFAAPGLSAAPQPVMLSRGEQIFFEDFSEALDPAEWLVARGGWRIEAGSLKGFELEADRHPAVIAKEADLRDAVIQFDFCFNGSSEFSFSTNHNRKGGHNSRIVLEPSGFTMKKDLNHDDPADSGATLGRCAYDFEPGTWYTLLVEYRGDEMLARIDEQSFVLGRNSYIDQPRVNVRFPTYGNSVLLDNIQAWRGIPRQDWPAKRLELLQAQAERRYADPKVAWQIAESSRRAALLREDPAFQAMVRESVRIGAALKAAYPLAMRGRSAGARERERLMAEDAAFAQLVDDLARARSAERAYLEEADPNLARLKARVPQTP